ncbi:MAG: hypothetical protein HOA95_03220, partial [Planctomycetes bacterium]|nr:hypothetical protein [Planctomycetota bacterium]
MINVECRRDLMNPCRFGGALLLLLLVGILGGTNAGFNAAVAQDDPGIARLEMKFERPRQITVFGGK